MFAIVLLMCTLTICHFTNSGGTWGKWDMCVFCLRWCVWCWGRVDGFCLGQGIGGWGGVKSGFSVLMGGVDTICTGFAKTAMTAPPRCINNLIEDHSAHIAIGLMLIDGIMLILSTFVLNKYSQLNV